MSKQAELIKILGAVAAGALLISCGGDTASYGDVDEQAVEKKIAEALAREGGANGSKDALTAAMKGEAPPPPGTQATPPTESEEGPKTAISLEPEEMDGRVQSTLDILNEAVEAYQTPATYGIEERIENLLLSMELRSEDEEALARTRLEERFAIKPMESLQDLVKARIVARIPDAPEGKKYVFNKETGMVEMVDAPAP